MYTATFRKTGYLMAVALLLGVQARAGVVSGTVTDVVTGFKIGGVTVQVKASSFSATTGHDGLFSLSDATAIAGVCTQPGNLPNTFSFNQKARTIVWSGARPEQVSLQTVDGSPIALRIQGDRVLVPQLSDGMHVLDVRTGERRTLSKLMVAGSVLSIGAPVPVFSASQAKTAGAGDVTLVFSKRGYLTKEMAAVLGGASLTVTLTKDLTGAFPTASTTGCSGTLKDYAGDLPVTSPGAIIKDRNVSGQIIIKAINVTIQNCRASSIKSVGYAGLVVEDCEMKWIGNDNFTMRRCKMAKQSDDLVRIGGPNVVIEDCFLEITGPEIDGTHADIIQELPLGTGTNTTIRHNTLLINMPQTQCINGPQGARVESNLMAGASYCMAVVKMRILNNHFSTMYYPKGGSRGVFYPPDAGQEPVECSGNVWHETGLPVGCP